ncbi:High-affinity glucose transporter ght2 [Lasiodiplodia theobromae]|uniref:High-affinity glucose transporter ght2 n=1 Tax=Lasiodiplodia theobromae TaxID=45133 RepID=A0A5N5DBF7_9PEZI|nr:High-affinity glucose transporter ght2 [Lasiodiplodia theobromae]
MTASVPETMRKGVPMYVRVSMLIAVGGMLFGLDTGTIGPVTAMSSFEKSFGSFSATVHGVVVSSILIPAALSSLITGNVADLYGRPRTIMFGASIFGIGAAIEAAANNLGAFIAGRIITGVGEGFFLSMLVVYVCEISPARRRGPLASLPQFCTTIGIAAGYFISYGTSRIDSSASWRVPLAFQSFMALSFAVFCTLVPPSPRWLLQKGRAKEAAQVLARLGVPASEMEESLQNSGEVSPDDRQPSLGENIRASFTEISKAFAPGVRKRTFLGCFMMGMQQFSGIDGVLYYAPLLFTQAGLSSEQASFLASGVSALVIFGTTIPATFFSDHWGRRPSTIYGGLGLAGTMVLIGSLYASNSVHGDHGAARWVVMVSIYVFAIIFSASWAIGFRVYASEIQPPKTRASASSLAQSANWFANFVVALTTPVFLAHSSYGVYFFFGACSLFTSAVCFVAMPETRGRTLETIDASFDHHSWRMKKKSSDAGSPAVGSETNSVVMQSVSPKRDDSTLPSANTVVG